MSSYGVIVGIDPNPPGWAPLQGCRQDAVEFRKWLTAPDGGGVPAENVFTACSGPPDLPSSQVGIRNAFSPILDKILLKEDRQFDRLFIYNSGHGLGDIHNIWDTGLIFSDSTYLAKENVALNRYADWAVKSRRFKQVICLTDCCRDVDPRFQIGIPQLPQMHSPGGNILPRKYYASAAHYGQQAREGDFNGTIHGYFTKALLEALDHAPGDDRGELRGHAVSKYIDDRIGQWDEGSGTIPQPEFFFNPVKDVVFGRAREKPFIIRLRVGPHFNNKHARLLFDGKGHPVEETVLSTGEQELPLKPGIYKLEVEDTTFSINFQSSPDTVIDVD